MFLVDKNNVRIIIVVRWHISSENKKEFNCNQTVFVFMWFAINELIFLCFWKGRKIRIKLDLFKPTKNNNRNLSLPHNKVAEQFNSKHGAKETNFDEQAAVYARVYKGNNFCWNPGRVIECIGNVMYVLLNDGKLIRSHVN